MLNSRLLLVDWPKDLSDPNLMDARPLGTREAIEARITELLPGATFSEGTGSFRRGSYQITFTLDGAEPTTVVVDVAGAEGLAAVKRLVERTGWQPIDPVSLALVDLDASRVMGATVRAAPAATSQPPASVQTSARLSWRPIVAMLVSAAVAWAAWNWMSAPPDPAAAGRSAADRMANSEKAMAVGRRLGEHFRRAGDLAPGFRDDPIVNQLLDFAEAAVNYNSSVGNGFAPPEALADPDRWQRIGPFLPASFGQSERDGYRFEWSGTSCNRYYERPFDECLRYTYVATPLTTNAGAPALTYALLGAFPQVHFREDGETPTESDPTVNTTSPSKVVRSEGPLTLKSLLSAIIGR